MMNQTRSRQGQAHEIEFVIMDLVEGYPRTPDSSEGLIPRAIICYTGVDPWVLFF